MSTLVDTWSGGNNLLLVEKVAHIASKHVGRCEDMIKELTFFFTGDTQKVEIVKSCAERMRDVTNQFKEDRRATKSRNVPELLQLAQELREKKVKFLSSTIGQPSITITVGSSLNSSIKPTLKDLQYLTPVKNLKTAKVNAPIAWREKLLSDLQQPIFMIEDLSKQELKEAELHRQRLKEQAQAARKESWQDTSMEKENSQMTHLLEIALRALLAENIKRYDIYKDHAGSGDIRWDLDVKDLPTSQNEILHMAKEAYAAKVVQVKGVDSLKPKALVDALEAERIKFEWFVKMFMTTDSAERAVKKLERSIGQIIHDSLLNSSDTSMQVYATLGEENAGVKDGTTTLFAFYRTKFSNLKAGQVKDKPTKSPLIKVNHISGETPLDIDDMPEDIKEAYSIFLQRPISKHPQGMPVSETHRQTESSSVESLWQMQDNLGKVVDWATSRKKKKGLDSDSDAEEPKGTHSSKKQKTATEADKKKSDKASEPTVQSLLKRIHKLETKGRDSNRQVNWADKNQKPSNGRDKSNQQKPSQVCWDFQKGKCARANCRFQHEGHEPQSERRRSIEIPDDACASIKAGKKCKQKGCAANHGKFKKTAKRQCWNEEKGQLCYNLFGKEGCHFLHEDSYSKNE